MNAGIVSFGRYIPRFRIKAETISREWKRSGEQVKSLGIVEKSVNAVDEDSFTMATEAALQAIALADIPSQKIEAVFVGSESHPYAVKPTSGMVANAISASPFCFSADLEFACKAGTAAMQIVGGFIESKKIRYGLAIGSDTAQARPGDVLEYSAAAGAAAFILGPNKGALARLDGMLSYTTDTPDFWRNSGGRFPEHAGRFTGEPGYFHHVITAAKELMKREKIEVRDIDHVVLHMPNGKFPKEAAKRLGFSKEQLELGFIVPTVGNTYSACSLLGLTFVLEKAKKDERILLVSYGSGAGADALLFTMQRDGQPLSMPPSETVELSYAEYLKHKNLATTR